MMPRIPRSGRLLALLLVAAVALAIMLPAAVRAAGSSASPAPSASASPSATPATAVSATPVAGTGVAGPGGAIYAANCSGCHGDHGQGFIGPSQQADAFPTLVAGMVTRGGIAMPAFPQLSPAQVAAVSVFVATQIPAPAARTASVAQGGELFRLYCSGCHGSTGRGGALSQGRNAPSLADYPAAEALAAMILGRGNMPVFADTTFDVRQQASVALYVQTLQAPPSPGGWGLGYIGPVTEGLVAFAGLGLLVVLAVWLAWGKGGAKGAATAATGPEETGASRASAGNEADGATAGEQAHEAPAPQRPAPGWPAAIGLIVAIAGAAGFVAFFIVGNNSQKIGGTMALGFLGFGFALAYWGRDLTSDEVEVGRYPLPPEPAAAGPGGAAADVPATLGDELARSAGVLTRRRFLTTLLVGAAAVLGLSQLALAATLGPKSRGLFSTAWRPGVRLVTIDGVPITRDALPGGGLIVAFPEGHTDAADSQVALLHLVGIAPQPGRESWSPESFFAYSRVCTHAGCAVAQYEDEAQMLLCPCHQSTFDLRDGARPVAGPAARPLPQLPLAIDADGYLIAQRDFTQPIGPGFWNLYA
jgi:ubiquinol-cytochrome c reductase iron-sulfur subunit